MRKIFFIVHVILLLLIISGCEENFSPKGDFEENFALTCIIRGDTSLQIASLFSSYMVDGYDPAVNDINPAYFGADIRLWYRDTVYVFEENRIYNPYNPDSIFHYYYLDKFKPVDKGELLEIEATLKNGKRLKASCYTPGSLEFDFQKTSSILPPVNTNNFNVFWTSEDVDNFYIGRLKIKYFENTVDSSVVQRWLYLPVRLVDNNGESIPIYPVVSKARVISYNMNAVNYAFQDLSEKFSEGNITVSTLGIIEVLSLEKNLSHYYASILEDNKYTVRVNESDYSNVEGGFGIFGSLNKETRSIRIQPDYISSFGFKVLYEN